MSSLTTETIALYSNCSPCYARLAEVSARHLNAHGGFVYADLTCAKRLTRHAFGDIGPAG